MVKQSLSPFAIAPLGLIYCLGCSEPTLTTHTPQQRVSASPVAVSPQPLPLQAPQPASVPSVEAYLQILAAQGSPRSSQGVWLQTATQLLANHQGTRPLPAASLTKIATSLVALKQLGPHHRFVTTIGMTGAIRQGTLDGDLVIQGGGDPYFIWETAFQLAQRLQEQGIERVNGRLIIVGPFYMNFKADPQTAGMLFQQAINHRLWPAEAQTQFQTLPVGTPKPEIAIAQPIQRRKTMPDNVQPLISHQSLPLVNLLKLMNRYSNNAMADMFSQAVGGAQRVAQQAAEAAQVPPTEIQLINGSGLGLENRLSPRAVCGLLMAIDRQLHRHQMTLSDVLAVIGQDTGVLDQRAIPPQTVAKSGTLNTVSALAGTLSSTKTGKVWFVLINGDGQVPAFRRQQDQLLWHYGY